MEWILMLVGFTIAAYATVANDSIQTLGTFLASNHRRPWWVLWAFSSSILVAVLVWSWMTYGGDASYGRLDRIPQPAQWSWIYIVPPVVLLALTRYGVPVSTTFLILTIFAPNNLGDMFMKSMLGYGLAFGLGMVVYMLVSKAFERHVLETSSAPPGRHWVALQWLSTAFLWSMWLVQDLANVFVYLPRQLSTGMFVGCLMLMVAMQAWIFYSAGGKIQRVVTSKTNTRDIRSATIIDFLYALILLYFKQLNNIPMSTTWVFLGLLGGREIAMTLQLRARPFGETLRLVATDGGKAFAGLAVSIGLALGLPALAQTLSPAPADDTQVAQGSDEAPATVSTAPATASAVTLPATIRR